MASCAYCGSTLLFVKKKVGDLQFCNDDHVRRGYLALRAREVPESDAFHLAMRMHQGLCPICHGPGPVDVHMSHSIWSALLLTSWKSTPAVSCRRCGIKAQSTALLSSVVLGWWGFPWGIIMTPVQIVRNVTAMAKRREAGTPSPELRHAARLRIAASSAGAPAQQ